eukprot:TRINITY_DN3854_c0_g1_i3.p1 TRINITY_DN3854_c0_g1~~TRINITY_DN3854_c0_g1_i3.p1  ORF type:complete len:685 (-),score=117.86 TRINITY_DN3854_c0_g1_i3:5040-7094(-)
MNMNKTILATLISTAFSSSVIAQSVNIELANLETEKVIQSQMDSIDSATLAKLNAQNSKVVALDGVVYEQDESGVWKAIGTGALGLTAALFSGSSSSSSNNVSNTPDIDNSPIVPDVDNGPIKDKPSLPMADNGLQAQWTVGEDEKGRKALMNKGEVVAYVANDGTRLRNADNEPLGLITSSINGNGATIYSVTLNNNSQFEGATITYREGNAGNQNFTVTTADGQTTYHWRQDRGFYKVDVDNNWGVVPDIDNGPILPDVDNGPIKDKPTLPEWNGETQIKTVEINGTTYLTGFVTGVGENARYVNVVGFGKDGNNAIRLNGSEGNDIRVITHDGEVTELRVNGQVITKEYLNGKDRLPVIDNSPILPEVDNGPIKDKPTLPEWNGETQIKTVEINGTTYLTGFVTGVGENARYVNVVGFGKDGNNAIRLNGSEGNDIRVITHEGEVTEVRINGQVLTKDYLNGKDRLPVADNSPILPEIDGGEGAKELRIIDGGIFLGEEKIGFVASDGNVNLYEHGKVGKAVYNGEGTLTAIKGDNGRELSLRDDRITLVGDRGSVTMSRSDGSIRIDHNYDQAPSGFQIVEKAGSFHILDGEGNKVGHVKKEDGNIIKDGVGVIGSVAQIGNTGVYSFYNKSGDFVGNYTPSTGEIERPDSRNDINSKLQSVDKSKLSNIKSRIQARFIK